MIRIDRSRVGVPPSLQFAMSDPHGECAVVRGTYPAPPAKPAKAFKFAAYKSNDVKNAIELLFHDKCAYCETHHGAGGPVDIEHFRPKGAIKEDPNHQGYWWFAMDWNNLLYSCLDCNRMRGQVLVRPGMTHEQVEIERQKTKRQNAGKKDSFPIRNARLQPEQNDIASEDALLLDPTRCDPSDHLTFVADENDRCLVIAKGPPNNPDPYGQMSIQVFGLNRSALVDARSMLWKKLRVQSEFLKEALDEHAAATTDQAKSKALDRARRIWLELESWAAPEQPYSGMTATFLDKLKAELGW